MVQVDHRDINELLNPNVFRNRPENLCNDLCHKSCCFGGLFMNVIGNNVRRLRKLHGLNQVEFANMVEVSQGSLSDIESGKSKPAVETVISIHERFGCSLEWLLCGKTSKSVKGDGNFELLHDTSTFGERVIEKQLLDAFRRLDDENQYEVIEIINIKCRKSDKRK
jgi:transcriptional regulator with XRE-family HTH domain